MATIEKDNKAEVLGHQHGFSCQFKKKKYRLQLSLFYLSIDYNNGIVLQFVMFGLPRHKCHIVTPVLSCDKYTAIFYREDEIGVSIK